jgi:predicted nucleic acid-binding protein
VILVDTSVWVDHLRRRDPQLVELLESHQVACHPFVIGEIACGRLRRREEILSLLAALPPSPVLDHAEALVFLEGRDLVASGIGWIDVHLLGAAVLGRLHLWTRDARLEKAGKRLGLVFTEG